MNLLLGKHHCARQWEAYNSAEIIGEVHLEAGVETAGGQEFELFPFKVAELFGKNDSNVVVDVPIRAKQFWPVRSDLGANCPGHIIVRFGRHFESLGRLSDEIKSFLSVERCGLREVYI